MSFYSLPGFASASIPALATGGLDMAHNTTPFITCEGRCSKHRVTWTTHEFIHEYRNKELHGWQQDYVCTICGECRQFGLTETRITPKGENN